MHKGFTLAETLIALVIIGVVAAVVISAFVYHINDKVLDAKRKTLLVRMNNAIPQMEELSGFGNKNDLVNTAAYDFITKGFSQVYKIGKVCNHEHIQECDIPEKIKRTDGKSEISFPTTIYGFSDTSRIDYYNNTKIAALQTINGDSLVVFYNQKCNNLIAKYTDREQFAPNICVHFVYDLNGKNKPNQIGKDIGIISVLYGKDTLPHIVSPKAYEKGIVGTGSFNNGNAICKSKNKNLRLPTVEEAASIAMAHNFYGFFWNKSFITSSIIAGDNENRIWLARHYSGSENAGAQKVSKDTEANIICVYEFNY